MNLNIAGKNLLLSGAWNPTSIIAALFTSDDYANDEVVGTGYARQAITYDAPAGGVLSVDSNNLAVFTIPAGVNFSHGALYVGGVRVGEGAIIAQSYPTGGSYRLSEASLTLSNVA